MKVAAVQLVWNPTELRYDEPSAVERSTERFLQLDRVPLDWLERAANLPGKALAVGLSIWALAMAIKSQTVMVTPDNVKNFGVDAATKSRALTALAGAKLISVERCKGRFPTVTLIVAGNAVSHRAAE